MKNILRTLKITVLVLIFYSGLFSSQLHVNINDPIYKYFDRLLTQGVLPNYMNTTLPLTRDYIADMLIQLERQQHRMSPIDIKILDDSPCSYSNNVFLIDGDPVDVRGLDKF